MANTRLLKIIQLNTNSIRSIEKRQELEHFLRANNPHILLLNETKLNEKHKVSFRNYNFIRTDNPNNQGGGTGILIKSTIKFEIQPPLNLKSLECTIIKVPLNNNDSIQIAAVYIAKAMQNSIDTNDLNKIVSLANNSPFIIGGDFNSHHPLWLSSHTDRNGKLLNEWYLKYFEKYSMALLSPLHPSRHLNSNHSYLDFFFVSTSIDIHHHQAYGTHLETIPFESDHDGVVLPVKTTNSTLKSDPITIKNYSNINWKSFNRKVELGLDNIQISNDRNMSNDEIENCLYKISFLLSNTIETDVPSIILHSTGQIPLPKNITDIIKHKNSLRRKLHRDRYITSPQTNQLKSQIKCINTMIKNLIALYYNKFYETKLKSIPPDQNQRCTTPQNWL